MTKPFKSVTDQLAILKSRGLTIEDDDAALHYLLYNNYYNVINHYGRFFQVAPDRYIEGASFNEIRYLFQFDKEMKSLFFKYSIDIEKNLKSLISYYYSESYRQPYSYLNPQNYQDAYSSDTIKCVYLLAALLKKHSESRTDNAVKHYSICHNDVPLWVLTNEMSFGLTNSFFKNMPLSIQNKVARCFSSDYAIEYGSSLLLTPDAAWKCLCSIQELRNTCGHNNRLLNHSFRQSLPYIPALYPDGYDSNSPRRSVYDTYLCMSIFMKKEQFNNLTKAIRKRMKNTLRNKLHSISYREILKSMGFPEDWLGQA